MPQTCTICTTYYGTCFSLYLTLYFLFWTNISSHTPTESSPPSATLTEHHINSHLQVTQPLPPPLPAIQSTTRKIPFFNRPKPASHYQYIQQSGQPTPLHTQQRTNTHYCTHTTHIVKTYDRNPGSITQTRYHRVRTQTWHNVTTHCNNCLNQNNSKAPTFDSQ